MTNHIRRTLFAVYAVILRPFIWAIIWIVGRTGVIKTIFVIYPHDKKEYSKLCPSNKFFVSFMSGRPTPGGVILDRWKPIGIYLFISNTPQELVKKKNRHLAETIVRRMRWIQKISGAKACGFAGQLGPILERRHGIAMEPPFFNSTMGNIFSLDDSILYLAKSKNKPPWQLSIAIVGGGELAEMLKEHFVPQGYKVDIVDLLFKRRGGTEIKNLKATKRQLDHVDFVINLLQTGEDFMTCGIAGILHHSTTVIDFSRPTIPKEKLQAKVFMGNRIRRPGMRFVFSLPGWHQEELPACSIPSILASNHGIIAQNLTEFCTAARQVAFGTALATPIQPVPKPLLAKLRSLGNLFFSKKNFTYLQHTTHKRF